MNTKFHKQKRISNAITFKAAGFSFFQFRLHSLHKNVGVHKSISAKWVLNRTHSRNYSPNARCDSINKHSWCGALHKIKSQFQEPKQRSTLPSSDITKDIQCLLSINDDVNEFARKLFNIRLFTTVHGNSTHKPMNAFGGSFYVTQE